MSKLINLTGLKFGKLTAISFEKGKWECLCECGIHIKIYGTHLNSGNSRSCGCLKTENLKARSYKLANGKRKYEPHIASAIRIWNKYKNHIDFETFLKISKQNCFYCGVIPNTKYNHFSTVSSRSSNKSKQDGLFIYNGISRIDTNKNYTTDNIVACCELCNRSKNNRNIDDFLQWISQLRIIEYKPIILINKDFPSSPLSSSIKCIFYRYKDDTDMFIEEFYSILQMQCYYCNNYPNIYFDRGKSDKKASKETKKNGSFNYNKLDKIDHLKPYNKNNIVPCCYYCNLAKSKLTLSEFQIWIKRVKDFK